MDTLDYFKTRWSVIVFRSLLAAWLLGAWLAWGQGALTELPLPPGYAYPRLPQVSVPDPLFDPPGCTTCGQEDELQLLQGDVVAFRRNLDRYAGSSVTWELLTFEHGFKTPWRGPQDAIRLYQHSPTEVRLVTRQELVVFAVTTAADGSRGLRCVSSDAWSVARDGERIVVRNRERRFAFATPDYGATWRLVETAPLGVPLRVVLHYDGASLLPTALEYPDGARATFTPAPGHADTVGTIALPNGICYRIEYDPNGFPRLLEEQVPPSAPPKPTLTGFTIARAGGELRQTLYQATPMAQPQVTRRWAWENDAQGRLAHHVGPCEREYALRFTEQTGAAGTATVAVVTDATSGDYRFLRHLEQADTWTIDRGQAPATVPLERAPYASRTVQQHAQHRMRLVARQAGPTAPVTRYQYNAQGQLSGATRHAPDGTLLDPSAALVPSCPANLPRYERDPASCQVTAYHHGQQTVTYHYDARGFLDGATPGDGQEHRFACDELGRLLRHDQPDRQEAWTYTSRNLVRTYRRLQPDRPALATTYICDDLDRLHRREPQGAAPVTYRHTCQGVQRVSYGEVASDTYRYDERGRVRERLRQRVDLPSPLRQVYGYDADHRLATLLEECPGQPPIKLRYRYDDAGRRAIASFTGPVAPAVLATIDTVVTIPGPPGSAPRLEPYNRYGGLIADAHP
jgi:YD repeat-containing protein